MSQEASLSMHFGLGAKKSILLNEVARRLKSPVDSNGFRLRFGEVLAASPEEAAEVGQDRFPKGFGSKIAKYPKESIGKNNLGRKSGPYRAVLWAIAM